MFPLCPLLNLNTTVKRTGLVDTDKNRIRWLKKMRRRSHNIEAKSVHQRFSRNHLLMRLSFFLDNKLYPQYPG